MNGRRYKAQLPDWTGLNLGRLTLVFCGCKEEMFKLWAFGMQRRQAKRQRKTFYHYYRYLCYCYLSYIKKKCFPHCESVQCNTGKRSLHLIREKLWAFGWQQRQAGRQRKTVYHYCRYLCYCYLSYIKKIFPPL